jgi:hypothetical protein
LVGWQRDAWIQSKLTAGVDPRGKPLTQAGLAVVEKKEAVRSYYEGPKPADLIIQTDKVTPEQDEYVTVPTGPPTIAAMMFCFLFLASCFLLLFACLPRRKSPVAKLPLHAAVLAIKLPALLLCVRALCVTGGPSLFFWLFAAIVSCGVV